MNMANSQEPRFRNQIAVVTGSAGGIGRACSLRLAAEGATTVNLDLDEDGLKTTDKMIRSVEGISEYHVCDITDDTMVREVIERIIQKYRRLHIVVNSAGIGFENGFVDISVDEWRKVFDVNLNGTFYVTQAVVKSMIENRFGKIINISSMSGVKAKARRTHYCASKYAVNGLTESLALELAPFGVNVNAVCPGRTETEMTKKVLQKRAESLGRSYEEVRKEYLASVPIGRLGQPEDIASVVSFLASEEAGYITGKCLEVSGGR